MASLSTTVASPRLHVACTKGNVALVKQYLNAGDCVDVIHQEYGRSPLFAAIIGEKLNVVKVLLSAGADVQFRDRHDYFPLYIAAQVGNIAIFKALLAAGADHDACVNDKGQGTVLFRAACEGNTAVARILIERGCDVNKKSANGMPPLAACVGYSGIVSMLLDAGASVNATGFCNNTALLVAGQRRKCDTIKQLIERGADVNRQDAQGFSALIRACSEGHDDVVETLVNSNADPNLKDIEQRCALHHACLEGYVKCVALLLRAGADITMSDEQGFSPMHISASKGHCDVIEYLLSAGAEVDIEEDPRRNPYMLNRYPLAMAAIQGRLNAVKLLIEAGADVNRLDAQGKNALYGAINLNVVKFLLEKGARADLIDVFGMTVLHHVAIRGAHAGVICALYKAGGVDPSLKNIDGKTAAAEARERGHLDAAKLFDMLAEKHKQKMSTEAKAGPTGEEKKQATDGPSLEVVGAYPGADNPKGKLWMVKLHDPKKGKEAREAEEREKEEQRLAKEPQKPCLNCDTLTGRRCTGCGVTSFCSHDCELSARHACWG